MNSQNEQIIEYLRGELEGDEKAAFEELLANDANFRKELEKQKNLWDLFGKLPEVDVSNRLKEKTLYAVKHYKNKSMKIRLFRAEDKIEQLKKKETRRLFTPVSAAAAVLILAAVVITILLSENALKMEFADEAKVANDEPAAIKSLKENAIEIADEEKEEKPEFMDEELEGWDSNNTKKTYILGNDSDSDDKPLKTLDNSNTDRVLWPEKAKLGSGYRGGHSGSAEFFKADGDVPPGNNAPNEEGFDGAPAADDKGSNDEIEYEEENSRRKESSNTYAFFLDLNHYMNEKLTTNQKLNLSYEITSKVNTRFDLARYEIVKDLSNFKNTDQFVVVMFKGTSAYSFNSNGSSNTYISSIKPLTATKETVSTITKELEQLKAKNYGSKNNDVLEAAKTTLDFAIDSFDSLKFFTVGNARSSLDKKKESKDSDFGEDSLSSNVEIVDLGGTGGLQGWASENGFSYSPR